MNLPLLDGNLSKKLILQILQEDLDIHFQRADRVFDVKSL